ncbi:MAG: Rv3235 family protein [Kineosporiaceae bacterium]
MRTSVGVPAAVPTLRRLPVPDAGPGPDRTAPPGSRTAARTGPPSGPEPEPEPPGPEPEPPGPEHRRWVSGFVLAAFEVTAGVRPSGQLVRWCTDDVRSTLRRQLALETSGGQVPDRRPGFPGARVLSVRSSAPDDGHVESAVTVAIGTRVRAVALRTEPLGGRWRVTALEIG